MANRARNAERYQQFLDAYRESPGNHHWVGKALRCDHRTAARVWAEGWAPEFPPIATVIGREQELARAVRHELTSKTELDAFQDAALARAQEGQLIASARESCLASCRQLAELQPAVEAIVEHLRQAIVLDADQATADESLARLERILKVQREAAQAAGELAALERKVMGAPDTRVEHVHRVELTPEERRHRLRLLQTIEAEGEPA